jgi:hypothetical protein
MTESEIMREIQLAASRAGHRLWRNHVGRFLDLDGRWHTCGLAVGSSDLIGVRSDGRFLSVEVKAGKGALKKEQKRWLEMIAKMGGLSGTARSVEEALNLIDP